jgi:hypothetical protein
MSTVNVAGALLLALPVAVNVAFGALAATFNYPDILRRPTHEVLARFREGGTKLLLWWWIFAITAAALAPTRRPGRPGARRRERDPARRRRQCRVLAALVPAARPHPVALPRPLPRPPRRRPRLHPTQREAVDIVFQSFNRYLGVAVGEHLGYLLTGTWTVLVGTALTQTTVAPGWLGISGIIIGAVLALCSLEFVGPVERDGWKLAATLTRSLTSPGHYGSWPAALHYCCDPS